MATNTQKHSIIGRLLIFVVFFLSTITASHFLTRYSFSNLEKYQIVVNKASEINDLADQVVYHANLVVDSKNLVDARNAQTKLADNLAEYQVVLDLLKSGGKEEIAGENVNLPACEPSLKPQLAKIEEIWSIYKTQSEFIIHTEITQSFIANEAQALDTRTRIIEKVNYLNTNRLRLLTLQKKFTDSYFALSRQQKDNANNWLWGLWLMNMSLIAVGAWLIMYWVVQPLRQISVVAHKISEGDLTQHVQYNRENEVGEVAIALNNMVQKIRSATDFIRNIEEGNLDVSYKDDEPSLNGNGLKLAQANSDVKRDALATALINMRERMKTVAMEESERNWATRGLAMFGEILQDYHDTTEMLAYEVISNLVRYMEANQGAIFLVNDETMNKNREGGEPETYLDLIAAYAYSKRKYVMKRVLPGEGLVGQSFKDADVIYISDIPADYADITSGLGGAQPNSILVVPLKLSDRVYGVVEIASFYTIPN
jgi:HAMP domain-containing protein